MTLDPGDRVDEGFAAAAHGGPSAAEAAEAAEAGAEAAGGEQRQLSVSRRLSGPHPVTGHFRPDCAEWHGPSLSVTLAIHTVLNSRVIKTHRQISISASSLRISSVILASA